MAYAVRMATNPAQDPIGEEAERVISDPRVRRRLEDFERRLANGLDAAICVRAAAPLRLCGCRLLCHQ